MISAIILNYFCANDTLSAVLSLLPDLDNDGFLEIHVVDNSVSCDQATVLGKSLDQRVKLILNRENTGFGRACNQVVQRTDSDYVLLLNPDAKLLPGALVLLHQFLEANPDVGAVGPIVYWDETRTFLLPPNIYPYRWLDLMRDKSRLVRNVYSRLWRWKAVRYWQRKQPIEQKTLSGGHVLLRRSAIEHAGGLFDPGFFMYFEDTDLFSRLRKAGYKLFMFPAAVAIHQFGGTAKDRMDWKQRLFAESARLFAQKYRYWQPIECLIGTLSKYMPSAPQTFNGTDLGELSAAPSFEIPEDLCNGWLAEWSLQADFSPAAGWRSKGRNLKVSRSLWDHIPDGDHFLRIGQPGVFGRTVNQYRWRTNHQNGGQIS